MLKNKYFLYLEYFIGLIVLGYLLYKGIIIAKDSMGYVDTIPIRSAGYSIIILLFQFLFGKYALNALFLFQLIFVFGSIQFFLNFLKNRFNLSYFVLFLISFIFYFNFYRYGGLITTEPLSYGLFLLFMKFFLESILESKQKSLFIAYALLIVLVLIRAQFYFLYPVVVLAIIFLLYKNRNWKFFGKSLSYFILILIVTNLLDKTYHYVRHDKFVGTPYTGIQLVSDALYVSKIGDSISFEGINKEMYLRLHQQITEQGLTLETLKKNNPKLGPTDIIFHYNHAYNEISHRNAKVLVGSYSRKNPENIDYWIEVDRMTIELAKKIILRNPISFIKLYAYDILRNGFFTSVFFLFFVIILTFSSYSIIKSPDNEFYIFLVLGSLIIVFNNFLVALVEPILDRYSFYGNMIYFVSIIIIISKLGDKMIKLEEE